MSNEIAPDTVSTPGNPESTEKGSAEQGAVAQASMPTLVLRILAGLHAGASRVLGEQEMLLIGSGEDCDIVLSDDGVASHHAMLLRNGNSLALRTIDAPAGYAGDPLYPGDPIELPLSAPVRLGEATFAIGDASDPAWMPHGDMDAEAHTPSNARQARSARLPAMLAGLAAVALISAAVYVWVQPGAEPAPQLDQQVAVLVTSYGISDSITTTNAAGVTVVTGTVPTGDARDRAQRHVEANALPVVLNLRTGDDVAADVAEVLRSQGITARTRYLGNGDVEISGRFEDQDKLRAAATSRAMIDVTGINRVIPHNFADDEAAAIAQAEVSAERTRIVSVVGGTDSYLLASDGTRYPVGAELPDNRGTLVAIGKAAWALVDGRIQQIEPDPPIKSEPPVDAEASAGDRVKATAAVKSASPPATATTVPAGTTTSTPTAAVARQYTAGNPRLRSNRM